MYSKDAEIEENCIKIETALKQLFESKNSEIGWDGSYGIEGTDAPSGIYTYNIIYKIPTNDERKLVNGHVYLLR